MQWLLFVVLMEIGSGVAAGVCSPTVKCITSENSESCKSKGLYLQDGVHFGGCCPGCVKFAELGDPCDTEPCAPGLVCNAKNICEDNKKSGCEKRRRDELSRKSAWVPECLPDDSFAPKQCKGEPLAGRCFCFNPTGQRIFGEEDWPKAANMTCACSSLMYELLQTRPDASLHCNSQGNFEELQCDNGVCWCAREENGEPFSSIVPEKMMKALPCYSVGTHGNQYLRVCDSQRVAQTHAANLLSIHGTQNINFPAVSCNYDGSYAKVQIKNSQQVCTAKDGMQINEYPTELNVDVDCNCAYDKFVNDPFSKTCDRNGNYLPKQANSYCVDRDGYYSGVQNC